MALRNRQVLMNVNKENVANSKSSIAAKTITTKRSVFGDLGNKVNTQRGVEPIGRSSLLKENKQIISKKNDATTKHAVVGGKTLDKIHEKPINKLQDKTAKIQDNKLQMQINKPSIKNEATIEINQLSLVPTIPIKKEKESLTSDHIIIKKEKESFSSDLITIENIDETDKENPILVSAYCNDIYEYLRTLEQKFPIKKDYLTGQEVTPKMRSVLIDWLVEVHQQFHLMQETLYLTISIIDRFLQSNKTIDRKRLQLVGVTAMFIASKYEEMYSPDVSDFVYITDNAYTKLEILKMELVIITTLDYSFGRPLPLHFLRRYSKAGKALPIHHTMAKYFLEQCLVHYEMCHYSPSLIAAGAIYLAFLIFDNNDENENKNIWTNTLEYYSTYTKEDILPVVRDIAVIINEADKSKFQAVRKKYVNAKYMKISVRPELKSPIIVSLAQKERQT
ncbi:PREDICTED: G2/mitotic-specific cyclin-B [Polistes dominula]|uniref:G2/mitotic-specific cyclin-B n=1 Tax=Polistes dominula TaxID=743375 RepID=A0ABM1I6H6_POLDO|nr:PREDICTED: G2/mitotic-specific cyclin-B [Polistes dominula]